jgi:hypothetical protein
MQQIVTYRWREQHIPNMGCKLARQSLNPQLRRSQLLLVYACPFHSAHTCIVGYLTLQWLSAGETYSLA